LLEIWQENECFKWFRNDDAPEHCVGCDHYKECKGGCRLFEEINFC
jgi:radical SAM protein with 4Fe4S-binding SPASM domain